MHKHIKRDDRICIALMLRQKYTYTDIAKELDFNKSTISREIKRNSLNKVYRVPLANRKAKERRKLFKVNYRIIDNNQKLKRKIKFYLIKGWSPEQIDKTLKFTSFMTIYRYIDRHKESKKFLRRQGKKRRKYGTGSNLSRHQANKRSIHIRPIEVSLKQRLGDWEGDTIVGEERKLRIVTYVDRKSGFLIANLITAKAGGIHSLVKQQFKLKVCKTRTYDNGSEFALHKMIEKDYWSLCLFCR